MSGRHPDQHASPDDAPTYSLDELSSEADVTPRTIRYYIAEGLLPPPDSAGRHARYTQEHLDRLRLIARMKEQYLPLKEIRRRLTSLPTVRLQSQSRPDMQAQASESRSAPEPSSAERYVSRALRESATSYEASAARASRRPPRRSRDTKQSWRRIPISDDAELLITEDAWERRGEQIESAITWIRRMLNE
jgi:DNA-binding transcriptional MerR regulator